MENFQNLILVYASKRLDYRFLAFQARFQLIALDYVEHQDRPLFYNRTGGVVYVKETIWYYACSQEQHMIKIQVLKVYSTFYPGYTESLVGKVAGGQHTKLSTPRHTVI